MKWLKTGFLFLGFFLFFPEFSLGQKSSPLGPDHFSATMESSFGGRMVSSRFYLSGKKVRLEPKMAGAMGQTYEILLPASGTMTVVMPAQHLCMKKDLPPESRAQLQALGARARKNSDLKVLGTGTFEGHRVIERLLTIHSDKQGGPVRIEFWNATDLENVPLKEVVTLTNGDVYTVVYKDIDLSDPAPALFVPPSSCTAFPDIRSMMKQFGMGHQSPTP